LSADSSHRSDFDDEKSTTGWVFLVNNGPVSWCSKKQSSVTISSMEAEYMALSEAGREAISRRNLFADLSIQLLHPPHILSDNQGGLAIIKEPPQYQRAKLLERIDRDEKDVYFSGRTGYINKQK
jgi:hypothetical protein